MVDMHEEKLHNKDITCIDTLFSHPYAVHSYLTTSAARDMIKP